MAASPTTSIRPQPGPQEAFLGSTADITIYGGAAGGGKTYAELLEPLRHVGNPRFEALILRRTNKEVQNVGGLWTESEGLYPLLGAEPRLGSLEWRFPSGARVKFDHMEHETDKHKYQGSQIPLIEFDELTHFTEGQFWYMLSRNRSTCGVKPYIRATCNPEPGWVAELIAWWIDQATGYAIPERAGVVRWFVRVGGKLLWADTPEELIERHPGSVPKSLTFIPARLEDNPALMEADPGYRANLLSLPSVERERLLHGNWKVRSQDGAEWGPECFAELYADLWPGGQFDASVMAIDPSKGKATGDYAAIVFAGLQGGMVYVDAVVARMSAQRIAQEAAELYREHLPAVVGIEANANQDLAFGSLCASAAIEAGLPPLPLVTIENREQKERRIFRLGPYLHGRQFRFRDTPGCRVLEDQLRGFPLKDVHDDGPDALEMAMRLLNQVCAVRAGTGEYVSELT